MNNFENVKALGRGAYAVVRLAKRRTDGALFVIKRFHQPLSELSVRERQEVRVPGGDVGGSGGSGRGADIV